MTFFVKYNGDLEKDPLNRGVEDFADYESAFEFAKRMTNKGLATTIYSGTIMEVKHQATFADQMSVANKVMKEDKDVLKELTNERER